MKYPLILLAALACNPALAGDYVAGNSQGDQIRLSDSPCVHAGTLALIPPTLREQFRKARAFVQGKDFFACWADTGRGSFFILYEDGDTQELPAGAFKEVPQI